MINGILVVGPSARRISGEVLNFGNTRTMPGEISVDGRHPAPAGRKLARFGASQTSLDVRAADATPR